MIGFGMVVVDQQIDVAHLARRTLRRGSNLLARLPDLTHPLASAQLLDNLARSRGSAPLIARTTTGTGTSP
jgi:hypothetical protein